LHLTVEQIYFPATRLAVLYRGAGETSGTFGTLLALKSIKKRVFNYFLNAFLAQKQHISPKL